MLSSSFAKSSSSSSDSQLKSTLLPPVRRCHNFHETQFFLQGNTLKKAIFIQPLTSTTNYNTIMPAYCQLQVACYYAQNHASIMSPSLLLIQDFVPTAQLVYNLPIMNIPLEIYAKKVSYIVNDRRSGVSGGTGGESLSFAKLTLSFTA